MQLAGATIAVTGATGFLGRYLVDLLLRRGARVVGVVRNPDRVPELRERGVELRRADLAERERLAAGFRGVDAVVSNAALLSLRHQRWADYVQTNVEGTVNVCEAAAAAGVRRIVYISSVAVYRGRRQRLLDEDHVQYGPEVRPARLNAYALSKALAEQAAFRLARERQLDLTVLRPGGIYGAFDGNFMPVFRAFMRPKLTLYPAWFRLAAGVRGRRRRGGRARAREARLDRPGLQHHRRGPLGVGLRARVEAGRRPQPLADAAGSVSLSEGVRHGARPRRARLARAALSRWLARDPGVGTPGSRAQRIRYWAFSSTRRLSARPSSVSLLAIGCDSP